MPKQEIKVGDSVTWTHVKQNGNRIGFSTREGKVVEMNNVVAKLKMRNGRCDHRAIKDLRKAGETTELTESFAAHCRVTAD